MSQCSFYHSATLLTELYQSSRSIQQGGEPAALLLCFFNDGV